MTGGETVQVFYEYSFFKVKNNLILVLYFLGTILFNITVLRNLFWDCLKSCYSKMKKNYLIWLIILQYLKHQKNQWLLHTSKKGKHTGRGEGEADLFGGGHSSLEGLWGRLWRGGGSGRVEALLSTTIALSCFSFSSFTQSLFCISSCIAFTRLSCTHEKKNFSCEICSMQA